jgi:DNA-binding response OmpR family regulator
MDREAACMKAGADGFIMKPFRPTELLDKIREMVEGV